jgi:hypothetical protein
VVGAPRFPVERGDSRLHCCVLLVWRGRLRLGEHGCVCCSCYVAGMCQLTTPLTHVHRATLMTVLLVRLHCRSR